MEDLDIITAYREKRNGICFRLLHDRYASKIYGKALTMLKKEATAKDATQEIFTKIFLSLGKFGGQSKFSTWVYSITYNYCIDLIRKEKRSRDIFADEVENPPDVEVEEVSDEALTTTKVNELRVVLREISNDSQCNPISQRATPATRDYFLIKGNQSKKRRTKFRPSRKILSKSHPSPAGIRLGG
jgi:RNA polymerase sigma-70 factor (ECF subfamily)